MTRLITVGAEQFELPESGEDFGWGGNVTSAVEALANSLGILQATGVSASVKNSPYNATGNGTTDDQPAFDSARLDFNTSGGLIQVPPGVYRFASNFSGSEKAVFLLEPGAIISPDNGITVSIHVIPPTRNRWITGPGTVIPLGVPAYIPEWWGVVPILADSATAATNTTNLQKLLDLTENSVACQLVLFTARGDYFITHAEIPTSRRIHLAGMTRVQSVLRQHSSVSGKLALLKTKGTGQEGPKIERMVLHGHANGGHVLQITNVQEAMLEDVQFADGGATSGGTKYAQLRIEDNSIRGSYRRLRFHVNTGVSSPSYGIWVGWEPDGVSPHVTNHWFEDVSSYAIANTNAYGDGSFIFVDHAGGCRFMNGKCDNVRSTGATVRINTSRAIFFDQFGTELTAGAASAMDYLVEESVLIEFYRSDMGHLEESPTAIKVVNSENVTVTKCWVVGTIDADVNTKNLRFKNSFFTKPATNWLVGAGTVFPKMVIEADCTTLAEETRRINGEFDQVPVTLVHTLYGAGDPEGAIDAPPQTLFVRSDGTAGSILYRKASGTGNTGWEAIA